MYDNCFQSRGILPTFVVSRIAAVAVILYPLPGHFKDPVPDT